MLLRGGAELSKGFFSALCKPRTILATIFRGLEKNARPAAAAGGELGAGKTDVEFFPVRLFLGADKSPERLAGVPGERLVVEKWVSVGLGEQQG